jgi:hypothetical protein
VIPNSSNWAVPDGALHLLYRISSQVSSRWKHYAPLAGPHLGAFLWCSKKKKVSLEQTEPPSIPVSDFFPEGEFPVGEIQDYRDDNLWRKTSAEMREQERLEKPLYENVRQAAEVHRQVRDTGGVPEEGLELSATHPCRDLEPPTSPSIRQ